MPPGPILDLGPTIGRRSVYKVGEFTGKEQLESYLQHFEVAAEINAWNDREKALFLAASLRGEAQDILSELPNSQRNDFAGLVAALRARFSPDKQLEVLRLQIKNRRQREGEPLATLAHTIKSLTRQAYPREHESLQRVVAKDSFVDALYESDTRLEVLKAQPETIDEALKVAARMDELKVAERLRSGS